MSSWSLLRVSCRQLSAETIDYGKGMVPETPRCSDETYQKFLAAHLTLPPRRRPPEAEIGKYVRWSPEASDALRKPSHQPVPRWVDEHVMPANTITRSQQYIGMYTFAFGTEHLRKMQAYWGLINVHNHRTQPYHRMTSFPKQDSYYRTSEHEKYGLSTWSRYALYMDYQANLHRLGGHSVRRDRIGNRLWFRQIYKVRGNAMKKVPKTSPKERLVGWKGGHRTNEYPNRPASKCTNVPFDQ